jgi:HAMP domain-containing protein
MTSTGKTLSQLLMALLALALLIFLAFMARTPVKDVADEEMVAKNLETAMPQDESKVPSPADEVYGFAIGNFRKAYRVSDFVKEGTIYDTIAGEGVLVSRISTGEIIMTHSDTGEVFIPVKTTWSLWVGLYPNTLLYENE